MRFDRRFGSGRLATADADGVAGNRQDGLLEPSSSRQVWHWLLYGKPMGHRGCVQLLLVVLDPRGLHLLRLVRLPRQRPRELWPRQVRHLHGVAGARRTMKI